MSLQGFVNSRQERKRSYKIWNCGCNVCTKDPENFDEEVKSLVTACRFPLVFGSRMLIPRRKTFDIKSLKQVSGSFPSSPDITLLTLQDYYLCNPDFYKSLTS